MDENTELRDQTVTDAVEDLELRDEAAHGVGCGDTVAKLIASMPSTQRGEFSPARNLE
jgi:hypothetical protein